MPNKEYDLAILTDADPTGGTDADVWIKLDGSASSSGWFNFREYHDLTNRQYFRPGSIEYASFLFRDLGTLEACSVELRSNKSASWLPVSIEVIDGNTSWTWAFNARVRNGEPTTKTDPLRDTAIVHRKDSRSRYDIAVIESTAILRRAEGQWRKNAANAQSPAEILAQILTVFEDARLLLKRQSLTTGPTDAAEP